MIDVDRLVSRVRGSKLRIRYAEAMFNTALLDYYIDRFELVTWARRLQSQHSPGTQAMFFKNTDPLDELLAEDPEELIEIIVKLSAATRLGDLPLREPEDLVGVPVPSFDDTSAAPEESSADAVGEQDADAAAPAASPQVEGAGSPLPADSASQGSMMDAA